MPREHRPAPERITDLASRVHQGRIRLPKFQRQFVWTRSQVLDLLDSIGRSYPIGSLLLWRSPLRLASEHAIAGLEIEASGDGEDASYVLDGCQRLSTICGALYWRPGADPGSFWNLAYDLIDERFLHRGDLDDPPAHQVPLRLLAEPSGFFRRVDGLPDRQRHSARELFDRFTSYEVAVVTLEATPFTEVGRIFERINTRGTPLTTVEVARAATWTTEFDLHDAIDRVRDSLARKHFGNVDRMLLLRAIAAAAGLGFATTDIESLADLPHADLELAIERTATAARLAVDFLTTEIGIPTAEALPFPNQLAPVIEVFRQTPAPDGSQFAAIRSWFWRTSLTGYYDGWNSTKMTADLAAIEAFAARRSRHINAETAPLSTRMWLSGQYRRDSARTKAYALMLAAAGPRDLRTGQKVDVGRALAMSNDMQFHHFFPKAWLARRGHCGEDANRLPNVVMLTALSNQAFGERPPGDYLKDEINLNGRPEIIDRLGSCLISPQALGAAMEGDYQGFLNARADTLLTWALDLVDGAEIAGPPAADRDADVERQELAAEVQDHDTDD